MKKGGVMVGAQWRSWSDGGRMQERVGVLGLREEADEIYGIALEDVRIGDVHAPVVDAEVGLVADLAARHP